MSYYYTTLCLDPIETYKHPENFKEKNEDLSLSERAHIKKPLSTKPQDNQSERSSRSNMISRRHTQIQPAFQSSSQSQFLTHPLYFRKQELNLIHGVKEKK